MTGFVIRWLVNVLALLVVVRLIPGIGIDSFETALWAALLLGLVNAFLRPVLIIGTLPLNVLSLGLFTLVINGALFYLVSRMVAGFHVESFFSAVAGAVALSVFSFLLNLLINPQGRVGVYRSAGGARSGPGEGMRRRRKKEVIDVEAMPHDGSRDDRRRLRAD